jgi:hypothetical protein
MMFCSLVTALLVLPTTAADKKVAMVLSLKGAIVIEASDGAKRPAKVMDMLVTEDRLHVPADGEATLVILGDNHRERIKANSKVTVSAAGCTPASAVERQDAVNTQVAYQDVHRFAGGGLGAVIVLRGPGIQLKPPRVTPMNGSTVLTNQPALAWQPAPGVSDYQVRLVLGRLDKDGEPDKILWTVSTKEAHLPYPKDAKALHFGSVYSWYVIARPGQKDEEVIWRSQFWVATREELAELTKIQPLAGSKDAGEVLLAALTYQEYGVYEKALALFERLAKQLPKESCFQAALADYYERAGRPQEAKEALKRAKELSSAGASR